MSIFQSVVAVRVLFILGIVNVVSGALVFLTCRCVPGSRFTGNLLGNGFYRRLYGIHCYVWPVFWVSVILHAVFALGSIGFPF